MEISHADFELLSQSVQQMSEFEFKSMAYIMAQILFIGARTRLGDMLGMHKLLILCALNVVVLMLGNFARGADFAQIIFDAPTLIGIQVLVDQLYKQYRKMGEDREKISHSGDSNDSGVQLK